VLTVNCPIGKYSISKSRNRYENVGNQTQGKDQPTLPVMNYFTTPSCPNASSYKAPPNPVKGIIFTPGA
jgi:hypothetical protein